ncbi:MAG: LptF/LptG family permease [Alphaproteobacteria bacterium]|nr:LptF/LptG family permease [Alphaproteobacteria bacterium]
MYRFKPSVLTRFLLRRFFVSFLLVMLTVCGIIYAVTFVERLSSNPDALSTLFDAWVRLLEYIPMFLPLAVFMGTLVAFYNLTKSSELIIISGAGLSPFQIAKPFLFGAFLVGVFTATIVNPYSVDLTTRNLTNNELKLIDDAIWLRESNDNSYLTLRAKNMQMTKNKDIIFKDATIFLQDEHFKLQERISAQKITLSSQGLDSEKASITNSDGITKTSSRHIDTKLTPSTVLERYLQPEQISFWKLPFFIKKMESIGVMTRGHLVQFWTLLFLPLTMMAMVTLGIAFSQTKQRRNYSFGLKFSLGIMTCFGLYFITNLFNALGNIGTLPPLIAIVAPQIIIIAGACVFITSFDSI